MLQLFVFVRIIIVIVYKEVMTVAVISFRIDDDVKESIDAIAAEIGMSTSTAMNVLARKFESHRGFPFEVVAPKYHDFEDEREAEALMDELSMEVIANAG